LDGKVALAIMFLYPIHQSLGQISGSFLYATERTGLQVKTGLVFMLSSMLVTYVVLAPRDALMPGLGLAAIGLSLKMVVMQFIQVNVLNILIARNMGWRFDWHYQVVSLSGVLLIGWLCSELARMSDFSLTVEFTISCLLFLPLVAVFLYLLPWLAGMTREELRADIHWARTRLQGKQHTF